MTFKQTIGDLPERVTAGNNKPALSAGSYVLVVLNRALRGEDNATIDAAITHANALHLPILVYSELDESVDWASDRLFYFALGAFRALAQSLDDRKIQCVQSIRGIGDEASRLKDLIVNAAVVYTDEDYTHWDRARVQYLLSLATQSVFLVEASRLVPTGSLPEKIRTTPAFRKAHGELREKFVLLRREVSKNETAKDLVHHGDIQGLNLSLTEGRQNFAQYTDSAIASLISKLNINHDLPISTEHPPTKSEISQRLETLKTKILSRYKWIRNNPALEYSTSELSPYLHFGMVSPHQVLAAVESSEVPKTYTWKFRDEFLTWREWSHYQAFYNPNIHEFEGLPNSAQKTLQAHANDERPELQTRTDIMHGNTPDATWNAAQKEWLSTGWLHNNLRMYWAKQILRFTASPQAAWESACMLNDYLSLDGRDPATYASMQWAFGNAKPGYGEKEIYGWVAPKSDRAILKRKGMKAWIETRQ